MYMNVVTPTRNIASSFLLRKITLFPSSFFSCITQTPGNEVDLEQPVSRKWFQTPKNLNWNLFTRVWRFSLFYRYYFPGQYCLGFFVLRHSWESQLFTPGMSQSVFLLTRDRSCQNVTFISHLITVSESSYWTIYFQSTVFSKTVFKGLNLKGS